MLLFEDGYDLAALAALPQAMMCRVENEVNELLGVAVAALSAKVTAPMFARNRSRRTTRKFSEFPNLGNWLAGAGVS